MSSFYTRYPGGGGAGVPTYANAAGLPGSATNGSLAVTLDTGFLYEYNAGTPGWQLIGQGGSITGSGVSPQVAYWNGTKSLTGHAGFTFDGTDLSLPGGVFLSGFANKLYADATQLITDTNILRVGGASGFQMNFGTSPSFLMRFAGVTAVELGVGVDPMHLWANGTGNDCDIGANNGHAFRTGFFATSLNTIRVNLNVAGSTGAIYETGSEMVLDPVTNIRFFGPSGPQWSYDGGFNELKLVADAFMLGVSNPLQLLFGNAGSTIGRSDDHRPGTLFLESYFTIGTHGASVTSSSVGVGRFENAALLGWRNAGNSADHTLGLNSTDFFQMSTGLMLSGNTSTSLGSNSTDIFVANNFRVGGSAGPQIGVTSGRLIFSTTVRWTALTATTVPYLDVNKDMQSSTTTPTELAGLHGLTASRVLTTDGAGILAASSVTTTTLAFLDATSSIQTQLNAKSPLVSPIFTGSVTLPNTGSATDGGSTLGTLDGTGTDSKRFNASYLKIFETIGDFGSIGPNGSLANDVSLRIGSPSVPMVALYSYNASGDLGVFRMRQSRGTSSSPTATSAGDYLGQIDWQSYNGSAFVASSLIYARATGSTSSDLYIQTTSGTTHLQGSLVAESGNNFDVTTTNMTIAAVAAFTNNAFVSIRGANAERLRVADSTGNFGTNSAPTMTFRDAAGTNGFELGFDGGASKNFNLINRLSTGAMLFYTSAATLAMTLDASQNATIVGQVRAASLGVGNSATATVAVGTLAKKIQVFDASGTSLGYIPVYASIT